jgi:RNA-directed DNA polymerase
VKTYCKRKDVSDVAFVKESISEFLLDRLDKSNVAKLFAYYNGISNTKSRKCINDSKEFVKDTVDCIAADISQNIRNRTVVDHILLVTPNEPLVKYVEIVDGLSGKKRELGIEKLIFQLYETIIRDATKEMFEAKIGEYQVASIKGRGQSYGKKHIKRWISSDPEGTKYCGKADVQKCYPSMPHDKLKALLHRDLRKSDMLLYLFDTIIYLYDYANELLGRNDCLGKGILIGSPVSKDLCNYYMSYLYHYINEKLFEKTVRRGKEKLTRLVSHVMIYMDDIVVFGGNKKYIHKAMEMIVAFTRDFLGLVIKPTWQKFLVSYKTNQGKTKGRNLDFMGFVFCGMEAFYRIYDGTKKRLKRIKVIVRDSIFLRGRRKFSKLIKKIKNRRTVSKHYAMSLLAYHGWIKNTDSFQFQSSVMWKEIIGIARNIVSRSEKGKPYTCDKYYQKWRTLYA